jgi:microcystin-dependent protein
MALFEITSSNTDVDIQKLKIEIESAVNILSAKVLSIEPGATEVKITIDAPATTSSTQLNDLKTLIIDAHDSLQRKRILVYDLPDHTGSASNKDYVDLKSSDTLDSAKQYTDQEIAKLVNSAPALLDTLGELSDALGDDPNFATTVAGQIGAVNTEIDSLENRIIDLETGAGTIGTDLTVLTQRVDQIQYNDIIVLQSDMTLKANRSELSAVATTGSYYDILNLPIFSTVATSGSYNDLLNLPNFATVATTGSYNDLLNTPTLFGGSYNDLTDKPVLADVATTGSYNDLLDKPVFAAALDDLTDVTVGSVTKGQLLVNNGTVFTNTNTIEASGSSATPLILKAATSQSADIFDIKNSSDISIFEINSLGQIAASTDRTSLVIKGASGITNSDLFQVTDSSSNILLAVRHHSTDTVQRWMSVATRLGVGSNDRPGVSLNVHNSSGSTIFQMTTSSESPAFEGGFRIFYNGTDVIQKICPASGKIIFYTGGGNANRVQIDSAGLLTCGYGVVINSGAAGTKGLLVKGAASQTANLIEAQNSSGTVVASIDASGNIISPTITSLQSQIAAGASSPTGSVIAFAGSSAPSGWLLCNGSAVSRTTYAILFGVIGTTYGVGDGSTTFNIPDLRSRIPVGKGDTVNSTLGQTDGVAEGSRSLTHTHNVTTLGHYHSTTSGNTLTAAGQSLSGVSRTASGTVGGSDGAHMHSIANRSGNANVGAAGVLAVLRGGSTGQGGATGADLGGTNEGGHGHGHSLSTNIDHTHSASSVTGDIGKLAAAGGVDGSVNQTVTSTTANNNNYILLNYIIKT